MQRRLLAAGVFGLLFLCSSVVKADEKSREEVSIQGTGFFTKDSSGRGITQHSTNSGGLLLSYRHYFNRWLGADVSYGYARNTQQNLVTTSPVGGGLGPGPVVLNIRDDVQTNIHQATAAIVVAVPARPWHLNPYVLAGTGALIFAPTGRPIGTLPGASTTSKATFVYGGGADYDFGKHFSFRLEYRGFAYKRADFGLPILRSGAGTYTSQPSAGVVVRF